MSKTDNKVIGYSSGAAIAEQLNKVTDLEQELGDKIIVYNGTIEPTGGEIALADFSTAKKLHLAKTATDATNYHTIPQIEIYEDGALTYSGRWSDNNMTYAPVSTSTQVDIVVKLISDNWWTVSLNVVAYTLSFADNAEPLLVAVNEGVVTTEQKVDTIEQKVSSIEDAIVQPIDYSHLPLLCGQPPILFGDGTPQEAVVPINWNQYNIETGDGYNWNGQPSAIGQQYINTSATTNGRYVAVPDGDGGLTWKNL